MITSQCQWCSKDVVRGGNRPGRFCSLTCKGEWQKTQKPVDRVWLEQKYVVEGLSTYDIGKLVSRDPKQVFNWLKGYGIPTRERGWSTESNQHPYQDAAWLQQEYVEKGRATDDIAVEFGVTAANIIHHLRRAGIARRTMSEVRAAKHWGANGDKNPMWGKRGAEVPSWKGGVTPARQKLYSTQAWKDAASLVRRRDAERCRRCWAAGSHIHHIAPFSNVTLRVEPYNLVLLCVECHRFVHSPRNTNRIFRVAAQ